MVISSAILPYKMIYKVKDEKKINNFDHILIRMRLKSCITDLRSFSNTNCDTNHFLVIATLRIIFLGH